MSFSRAVAHVRRRDKEELDGRWRQSQLERMMFAVDTSAASAVEFPLARVAPSHVAWWLAELKNRGYSAEFRLSKRHVFEGEKFLSWPTIVVAKSSCPAATEHLDE